MAVPRNRTSHSRTNTRRSHHAKVPLNTCACPNCEKPRIPHRICRFCGHYAKRSFIKEGSKS